LKNFKNRVSFQEDRSTGYRPETEFNSITVSEHAYLETPFGSHSLLFGYARKDFGADSFYSNRFDNEEEHTDTRFIKVDSDFKDGDLVMKPVLFLRRHRDKFALDRNRPGWQTNYHTTYNYGGEVGFLQHSEFADVACGFELSQETIDSTNMQQHRRTKDGVYVELNPKLAEKLLLNIGFREDRYDDFGWEYSPSLGASYRLWDHYKIRSSAGRSFRVPTFTDLYYRDSGNVGRSDLRPETSWSYEVGLDYDARGLSLKTTVFRREVNDTIDWTRSDTRSAWQAKNIGTVDTNGLEIGLDIDLRATMKGMPLERAFVNYTALDSYFKHEYLSKYASDYLKQHISGGLRVELPYGVKNSWVINYKKRVGDSGFIVVDAHLSKEILKEKKMTCEAFVDVTNIFDAIYSEQSDLDMPGRWIKSGARMRF
jgi:iron complex outermembrane receptor protein